MTGMEKVEAKIRNQVKTRLNKMHCEELAKEVGKLSFHAVTNLNWVLMLNTLQTSLINKGQK